jgi:molybdopterin-guanine dinucleotide biosynthesis protein A
MRVLGVILAGGEGARLGGVDKALELIAGRTCLDRVVERLGPQVEALALVAAGPADAYGPLSVAILRDAGWPAREGPMAGVLAGLRAAAEGGFEAALTIAVDTPFCPLDLRRRLEVAGAPGEIAIAASAGQAHPVFGLWPAAHAAGAQAFFETGGRSPDRFSRTVGRVLVDWPATPFDPFANLNTPDDRAALEAIAASLAP